MHTPDFATPAPAPAPPVRKPDAGPVAVPAAPGGELAQALELRAAAAWPDIAKAARAALAAGKTAEAERLHREAILAAVPGAVYPAGLPPLKPAPDDIRIDLTLKTGSKTGTETEAETRNAEVPLNEANWWRWIYFGPGTLGSTRAHTEAVITHELVHVRQLRDQRLAWNALPAAGRPTWDDYIRPFNLDVRVHGPQELEAYRTGLGFLSRLDKKERREALRGVFVSYVNATAYAPAAGVALEISTATVGPELLDAYAKASPDLQNELGAELWWSLLYVDPAKEVWQRVLVELAPIARKGYEDATFRPHYDTFLRLKGLTFADVMGGKADAGTGP